MLKYPVSVFKIKPVSVTHVPSESGLCNFIRYIACQQDEDEYFDAVESTDMM